MVCSSTHPWASRVVPLIPWTEPLAPCVAPRLPCVVFIFGHHGTVTLFSGPGAPRCINPPQGVRGRLWCGMPLAPGRPSVPMTDAAPPIAQGDDPPPAEGPTAETQVDAEAPEPRPPAGLQPCTLCRTPSTLCSTPSTPSTLRSTPGTLRSTPSTLCSTASTL